MISKYTVAILALLASASPLLAASGEGTVPVPDFTKGEPIHAQTKHDWNLGATGARDSMRGVALSGPEAIFGTILKNPLDGVDHDLLRKAFAATEKTELLQIR